MSTLHMENEFFRRWVFEAIADVVNTSRMNTGEFRECALTFYATSMVDCQVGANSLYTDLVEASMRYTNEVTANKRVLH